MDERRALRGKTIRALARLEGVGVDATVDRIVDAGIRVLLRKHRKGCGFDGCKRRCLEHPRGQMRLVWPEALKTREGQ